MKAQFSTTTVANSEQTQLQGPYHTTLTGTLGIGYPLNCSTNHRHHQALTNMMNGDNRNPNPNHHVIHNTSDVLNYLHNNSASISETIMARVHEAKTNNSLYLSQQAGGMVSKEGRRDSATNGRLSPRPQNIGSLTESAATALSMAAPHTTLRDGGVNMHMRSANDVEEGLDVVDVGANNGGGQAMNNDTSVVATTGLTTPSPPQTFPPAVTTSAEAEAPPQRVKGITIANTTIQTRLACGGIFALIGAALTVGGAVLVWYASKSSVSFEVERPLKPIPTLIPPKVPPPTMMTTTVEPITGSELSSSGGVTTATALITMTTIPVDNPVKYVITSGDPTWQALRVPGIFLIAVGCACLVGGLLLVFVTMWFVSTGRVHVKEEKGNNGGTCIVAGGQSNSDNSEDFELTNIRCEVSPTTAAGIGRSGMKTSAINTPTAINAVVSSMTDLNASKGCLKTKSSFQSKKIIPIDERERRAAAEIYQMRQQRREERMTAKLEMMQKLHNAMKNDDANLPAAAVSPPATSPTCTSDDESLSSAAVSSPIGDISVNQSPCQSVVLLSTSLMSAAGEADHHLSNLLGQQRWNKSSAVGSSDGLLMDMMSEKEKKKAVKRLQKKMHNNTVAHQCADPPIPEATARQKGRVATEVALPEDTEGGYDNRRRDSAAYSSSNASGGLRFDAFALQSDAADKSQQSLQTPTQQAGEYTCGHRDNINPHNATIINTALVSAPMSFARPCSVSAAPTLGSTSMSANRHPSEAATNYSGGLGVAMLGMVPAAAVGLGGTGSGNCSSSVYDISSDAAAGVTLAPPMAILSRSEGGSSGHEGKPV